MLGGLSSSATIGDADVAGFAGLARSRRSVRQYTSEPVDRHLLDLLIAVAAEAPSNLNRQPWRFVVVDTSAETAMLLDALRSAVGRARGIADSALQLLVEHADLWAAGIESAPVHVLVFTHRLTPTLSGPFEFLDPANETYDPNTLSTGMAIQNLLLAAHERGLGACMHANPVPFLRSTINGLVALPKTAQLVGWVTIGYPAERPSHPGRRPLERTRRYQRESM